MIDEKKLIEEIEFSIKASNTQHDNYMSGLRNGMRYCLSLVTGKEPEFEDCEQWIPCSERLPSKDEFKKAYLRNKYGAEFIVMIEGANRPTTLYLTSDGLWVDDYRNVHEVIAWQPLPEQYQNDEQEEK